MTATPQVSGSKLSGQERDRYVATLFDEIAPQYDGLNRWISLGQDRSWRKAALRWAGVRPGMSVVDLGTGTGDVYLLLREAVGESGSVIGIDVAANMLALAREKAQQQFPDQPHDLRVGHAADTGLPDACADLVTMGWVLRNIGDRPSAYREILRILKPGGRLLVIDMSQPSFAPLRWGSQLYMNWLMPSVVRITGGDVQAYRYLADSTAAFPNKPALAKELAEHGFVQPAWRSRMLGAIGIHRAEKPDTTTTSERIN